ncbi:MAG: hypothetical protein QXS27_08940, partial [Candidatus Jordarchaeaceae archaeon]
QDKTHPSPKDKPTKDRKTPKKQPTKHLFFKERSTSPINAITPLLAHLHNFIKNFTIEEKPTNQSEQPPHHP